MCGARKQRINQNVCGNHKYLTTETPRILTSQSSHRHILRCTLRFDYNLSLSRWLRTIRDGSCITV